MRRIFEVIQGPRNCIRVPSFGLLVSGAPTISSPYAVDLREKITPLHLACASEHPVAKRPVALTPPDARSTFEC